MPNAIQPGEYSMGGGIDEILYITATRIATSTFAICTGTMVGGTGATTGLTTTLTTTTLPVSSQLSSFLPCLYGGGVLFYKLSIPTTKHSAYFV
jgi:hypothetical protein